MKSMFHIKPLSRRLIIFFRTKMTGNRFWSFGWQLNLNR